MENWGIGSVHEVDKTDRPSLQIARFRCKERWKGDLEWLVAEKADALAGIKFDDVERSILETETTAEGGEIIREARNGIDK